MAHKKKTSNKALIAWIGGGILLLVVILTQSNAFRQFLTGAVTAPAYNPTGISGGCFESEPGKPLTCRVTTQGDCDVKTGAIFQPAPQGEECPKDKFGFTRVNGLLTYDKECKDLEALPNLVQSTEAGLQQKCSDVLNKELAKYSAQGICPQGQKLAWRVPPTVVYSAGYEPETLVVGIAQVGFYGGKCQAKGACYGIYECATLSSESTQPANTGPISTTATNP